MKIVFDRGTLRNAEKWAQRSRLGHPSKPKTQVISEPHSITRPSESQSGTPKRLTTPRTREKAEAT
jgi:hypothetical protein